MQFKDWLTVAGTALGLTFAWWQWRRKQSGERLARIKTLFDLAPVAPKPLDEACRRVATDLLKEELEIPSGRKASWPEIAIMAVFVAVVVVAYAVWVTLTVRSIPPADASDVPSWIRPAYALMIGSATAMLVAFVRATVRMLIASRRGVFLIRVTGMAEVRKTLADHRMRIHLRN